MSGMAHSVDEDFLAHYGKKGMKWGVRKAKVSAPAASTPGPKKAESGDASKSVYTSKNGRIVKVDLETGKVSGPKKMTDEELRQAISRIDMERKYATLTAPAPSKKTQAAKIVADILVDIGKQQAKKILLDQSTIQLEKRGVILPTQKKKK